MKKVVFLSLIIAFFLYIPTIKGQDKKDCKVLKEEISDSYEGGCKKGFAHGQGHAKGVDDYVGKFKKGLPHGFGSYTYSNGDKYKGDWSKGLRHGMGKFESADKSIKREGIWKNNKFDKEKEFPKYNIILKQNVQNISISSQNTTIDKIEIHYIRDGKEGIDIQNKSINGTSGIQENVSNYTVFTNVNYPFECNISFKAKGRFSTTTQVDRNTYNRNDMAVTDYKVEFRINEPGYWVVWIKY